MTRRIVLATGNAGKLREMRAILAGHDLVVVAQSEFGIVPPVEDGDSFAANALIKARYAAVIAGLPAIADDSGLEVDALGGRPGLHTARYAGPQADEQANNDKLLAELSGVPLASRGARYCCAMAFVRDAGDAAPIIAEASWSGRIGFERRGKGGFGYDPLFIPNGYEQTFGQLREEVKNRLSHRAEALAALKQRLESAKAEARRR